MKKIVIFIAVIMILLSCATTKETKTSRVELKNEKKLAEQAVIKRAVESRRFIIKLDRLYFSHGGRADLFPRSNYIIIDGEKAILRTAYLGRQFDIRPIAGINIKGRSSNYELKNDSSKGDYEINMEVSNGSNSFDIYLKINKNGNCNASVSNMRIDYVRYSGQVVPIRDTEAVPLNNDLRI